MDVLLPWSDFGPKPQVGTSIFLVWWSEPTLAIWSERLAKGPYQKNTPPAVGLEPAILRLQIQAFINWAILAPLTKKEKTTRERIVVISVLHLFVTSKVNESAWPRDWQSPIYKFISVKYTLNITRGKRSGDDNTSTHEAVTQIAQLLVVKGYLKELWHCRTFGVVFSILTEATPHSLQR